jgi:predicted PurR-regulated permease PerM
MHALIAIILAVIYTLEQEELHELSEKVDAASLMGTIMRWLGYLAEAIRITIQLQVVVAAVNTVLTLPVLLLLGIHHIPALMILIFVSALVPVVGNIISGAVLSLLAYQAKGMLGIGVFVALTFVLHKIEAYYLNPRLTSKHVHLPGFAIVVSLIAWEHLLGFVGLFVSFPFLFVASKIRGEMIRASDHPKE